MWKTTSSHPTPRSAQSFAFLASSQSKYVTATLVGASQCVLDSQKDSSRPRPSYLSGARFEAIFTTWVWSSVSHASTPLASASDRPSPTAASCVGDTACGASGMMLISCSRTAVGCETRTSPGFTSDND
jgi:hypothetical protein